MLYIFDLDGTLVEFPDGVELLPGVADKLRSLGGLNHRFAIASNQGGVGIRTALEEDTGFHQWWRNRHGRGAEDYPSAEDATLRISAVCDRMEECLGPADTVIARACFVYVNGSGRVYKSDITNPNDKRWDPNSRKPLPGMLLDLMKATNTAPSDTLMVGDRDEDRQAAQAAGVSFQYAEEFFAVEIDW